MSIEAVFIRADASPKTGMGHVKRCLVVAKEIIKKNIPVFYISESLPDSFQKELKELGIGILHKPESSLEVNFISQAVKQYQKTAILVDSYKDEFYLEATQQGLTKTVDKVAYIIFDKIVHYSVDILHNQNPLSIEFNYTIEPHTKTLFGLDNLILEEQFRDYIKTKSKINKVNNTALLTFGGSDPQHLTLKTLQGIETAQLHFDKLIVVIGGMYLFREELDKFCNTTSLNIEIHQNTRKMQELMNQSNIAFVAGGITNWELGALGIPFIILPAGEMELKSAQNLAKLNYAQVIETPSSLSNNELGKALKLCIKNNLEEKAQILQSAINIDGVEILVQAMTENS